MKLSNESILLVREQYSLAQETKSKTKVQFENAEKEEKVLKDIIEYIEKEWWMHLFDLMNKQASLFQIILERNDKLKAVFEEIKLQEKDFKKVFRQYPSLLERLCNEANLKIDIDSRHPRYSLYDKFIRLEIDENKRIAKLYDHENKLGELPADISAVVEKLIFEQNRLFNRGFDSKKFLKRIRKEYLALIKKEMKKDGESIPIRQITRRLGKNLKRFRTDEFLVDLSRLVESGQVVIENVQLDLQQTKDTNQGMLLLGASARGYIGYVVFKEVSK